MRFVPRQWRLNLGTHEVHLQHAPTTMHASIIGTRSEIHAYQEYIFSIETEWSTSSWIDLVWKWKLLWFVIWTVEPLWAHPLAGRDVELLQFGPDEWLVAVGRVNLGTQLFSQPIEAYSYFYQMMLNFLAFWVTSRGCFPSSRGGP